MHGIFDNNLLKVKFKLYGTDQALAQEFEGLIDTGCNGYLQIPLVGALPLGMRLVGVEQTVIANGSTVASLVCEGTIEINGVTLPTAVSLQDGPILIGTQLLAKLGQDLKIDFSTGTFEFSEKSKEKI